MIPPIAAIRAIYRRWRRGEPQLLPGDLVLVREGSDDRYSDKPWLARLSERAGDSWRAHVASGPEGLTLRPKKTGIIKAPGDPVFLSPQDKLTLWEPVRA